jgi:hemerythrin-like domain-containing protein
MEIFDYLTEEGTLIERKLADLVGTFNDHSREDVFDQVKFFCDATIGYLDKQNGLLFERIKDLEETYKSEMADHINNMQLLRGEIETLTMVHVDEPGYDRYLNSLLEHIRKCNSSLQKLGEFLKTKLPASRLASINEELEKVVHSPVGFNEMPVQKAL